MDWSAGQYAKFEAERSRPARDLLAAIERRSALSAIDLGCGPGNSTELLQARFPEARVIGIDSSPDMIAAARLRLPGLEFCIADIAAWNRAERYDVILANASLQWLPDHATLFPALLARLAPAGTLAVQMPDNLDEPSHALMRTVAAEPAFAGRLADAARARAPRHAPDWYFRLLSAAGARADVWRATYFHPMAGLDAVIEWLRGTGLRPFLAPLDADGQQAFLDRYRTLLDGVFPALSGGGLLFPFPRLFLVAQL